MSAGADAGRRGRILILVFDHHDLVPEICLSRWTGWRRALLHRLSLWAERATYRTADPVIATNESYRDIALRRGCVPPERVCVVRSGPSLSRFRAVAPRPEPKNGRPFLVAYLGVMGPNDGVEHLLQAIAHIVHTLQRRDVQFVLIGAGDLRDRLVAMSRDADRRRAMGQSARRRFETALAGEHQRPVLLALYRDLLGA